MSITVDRSDDGSPVTTLEGSLEDQEQLWRVLNTLYDLHFPVIWVETLDETASGCAP